MLSNEDSTLKHFSYTSENVQTFKTDCIFLCRFDLHEFGFVPTKHTTSLGIYRLMIFNLQMDWGNSILRQLIWMLLESVATVIPTSQALLVIVPNQLLATSQSQMKLYYWRRTYASTVNLTAWILQTIYLVATLAPE